jgi:DNA-binding MarR family transcriptional regulator
VPKITEFRKKAPDLLAETESLRQEVRRLLIENQRLRAQLCAVQKPTNSLEEAAKRVLALIGKEPQILVRDIAHRMRFRATKVERLLEDLEFEGLVQSRLSLKGTFYSLTPSGQKCLTSK